MLGPVPAGWALLPLAAAVLVIRWGGGIVKR